MPNMKRATPISGWTGAWTLALVFGFLALLRYEGISGKVADSPQEWPRKSKIIPTPGNLTLVMVAHPRCPCTHASIVELRRVLECSKRPVDVRILFYKARGADWPPTDLWRQAAAIAGACVAWDEDGTEAAKFGACTSGHALLFDGDGKLLFSGGITSSRGHVGPSKGNLSLAAWLTPGGSGHGTALVFGCSLIDPQSVCTIGTKACQARQ